MTDQPQTALAQFLAAAKRIEGIPREADGVRRHPDRVADDVSKISIYANHARWNYQTVPLAATEAADRIKAEVAAEFRADAERERDAKLHALAAEMESIRATLPALAAKAAIELGHQSRMLAYEANGGCDV